MSKIFSGEGNPFYGKHHSDETKKKISDSLKGKYKGEKHPFYGKHHSKESLQKISNSRKSKGGKKIICLNTGEVFPTMMDAARWCGLSNSSSIGQICNHTGQRKTAGKHPITKEKLKWEFYNE
jgi:group I intron endonuclease